MAEVWGALAVAAVGAGTAIYSADQQRKNNNKTLDAQRRIIDEDIKYQPIDIEKLKADATQQAIQNATQSLALERSLQPDVADVRQELSRQVSADLKLGGNLSPDVTNRVTTAGRVIGARSGIGSGSTTPLTASLLGLSSVDLLNQRRAAAGNLLQANDLPNAGLGPGEIASAEVAQNAAQNQFNLAKAGVESNLIQSEADARAAQLGGQAGTISSLTNLLGKGLGAYNSYQGTTNYADLLKKIPNQNAATNPLMGSSSGGTMLT